VKSRRRKAEEAKAALAPHGRQLSLMLATQRGMLTRLQEALAREKSEQRRAGLELEISNVKAVIAIRERELAEALATVENERVQQTSGGFSLTPQTAIEE